MRNVILVVIALIVGFVAGSFAPRGELRDAETQIAKLKKELAAKPKGMGIMGQLALAGGIGSKGRSTLFSEPDAVEITPQAKLTEIPKEVASTEKKDKEPVVEDAPHAEKMRDDLREIAKSGRLDEARTALDMRQAQARAALMEQADLNDDEMEAFDDAVDQMNDDLALFVEEAAVFMEEGREPNRREAMELAAGALDVLLSADSAFEDALGEDIYDDVDEEAIDPTAYIDSSLIDLLEEL